MGPNPILHAQLLSHFQLSETPWTVARQAPPSMGFPRRILEWVAISFSRGSSPLMDQTCVSCIGGWVLLPLRHQGSPCRILGFSYLGFFVCTKLGRLGWHKHSMTPNTEVGGPAKSSASGSEAPAVGQTPPGSGNRALN